MITMIKIKTQKEIDIMRKAGKIVAETLELVGKNIKPGVSTGQLDKLAHKYITDCGAKPSFLHYAGFPASICTSVDDVVVHGIPSYSQILQEGQIIGIDVGAYFKGYHADAARTFPVGRIDARVQKLIDVTRECFFEATKTLKNGSRLGDIGAAVQKHAEKNGFSVVRELVGHGVGKALHELPNVLNYGIAGTGIKLLSGMTLAIEPMINMGQKEVVFPSGILCKTRDGLPSAHYENTVLVTDDGVEILTLPSDE